MRSKADNTGRPAASAQGVLAPDNLPFQLHLLVQGMTRKMQHVLDPFDLTPLHWGMLCCLWRQDGLSATDFADQLSQLGGTITVALKAMERRKLILRRAHPKDGRSMQVFLTPRARAIEQDLVPKAAELIRDLFSELSPAEYDRFSGVVRSLRTRTEKASLP